MKTLWTDQYLSDLATEAEIQISSAVPCIYTRFPLNIVLNQSLYDFESTTDTPVAQRLTGIIRVTWQGWTVHPVFQEQLRNIVIPFYPNEGNPTSSRPLMYIRQGYGMNKIKFYPSPNATITYDSSDISKKAGITANVIVAGWRIADVSGSTYRIPDYVRFSLVRYYVLEHAYRKEGKGQNLEASDYYAARYVILLEQFKKIVMNLFASRTVRQGEAAWFRFGLRPPRPVLPPNFGPEII